MRSSRLAPFLLVGVLSACSLISPYTITFTNEPGSVIDPQTSTLDFVVSQPTLAYISRVVCTDSEAFELLPIVPDSEPSSTVHKLSLDLLSEQTPGSDCEVTVAVFDKTTTEQSSASIHLTIAGEVPMDDQETPQQEETAPEETVPTENIESTEPQGLVPEGLVPPDVTKETPTEEPTSLEPVPMPNTTTPPSENTGIVPPQY